MEQRTDARSDIAHDSSDERPLTDAVDLLIEIGRQKGLLLGIPGAAVAIAFLVWLVLPPTYTAVTSILPAQQQNSLATAALQQLGGLAAVVGSATVRRPEDLYIAVLRGPRLQDVLIDRFALAQRYGKKLREDSRKALSKRVEVRSNKSGLVWIEVEDRDPDFAAKLANAHVEELRTIFGSLAVTEAQQRRIFFEQQLRRTKQALADAEVELRKTQERTGLIALERQGEAVIQAIARLKAEIVSREVQLEAMKTYATPRNAELQRLLSELSRLRSELAQLESGQTEGAGQVIPSPVKVPGFGLDYVRALREVKYQEAMFELLARQFEYARADEAREGPLVQQVEKAIPPQKPTSPKLGLLVGAAFIGGLVLACGFVCLRIWIRHQTRDPARASRMTQLRDAWNIRDPR